MAVFSIVALFLAPEWITLPFFKTSELFWHVFRFFLMRVVLHVGFVEAAFYFECRILLDFLVADFLLLYDLFIGVFASIVRAWQVCNVRRV